ncbi:MAG TPA: DUF4369 domain-containing protein [Flavobacteriaceae bacterium]|nr:DUF4369 domain-containing protein [Flavobacteriaceae bacterium]
MKTKFIRSVATLILVVSCTKETPNFTLIGTVKGLRKGTVYLERAKDSTYKIIDSVVINGNPEFQLHYNLEEPEVLFLRLNKNDDKGDIITFFADSGVTQINTTLKNFNFDAKIKGSKQQELLEEYRAMMSKFNDQNLDMIKERFDPEKRNDTLSDSDFEDKYNNLLRRQYLYTINFAVTHNASEVAPYLAVTEIADANTKFLDTIYNLLDSNMKSTIYGKKLKRLIEQRKQQ